MDLLVGIDDTDNLETRGTGHRARRLGDTLEVAGIRNLGITRHQLLVDPRIPYTSHNSSACLAVTCGAPLVDTLSSICTEFLLRESAPGSDAGLCVAPRDQVTGDIVTFGGRAKTDVLSIPEADALARAHGIHLAGLTGTGGGVIGALAAVGLRAGGNDGRFLWLNGLRELQGVHTISELRALVSLDAIETETGRVAHPHDRIDVGEWPRPILRGGRIVLLVEESGREDSDWMVASKTRIKEFSA